MQSLNLCNPKELENDRDGKRLVSCNEITCHGSLRSKWGDQPFAWLKISKQKKITSAKFKLMLPFECMSAIVVGDTWGGAMRIASIHESQLAPHHIWTFVKWSYCEPICGRFLL